MKNTKPPIVLLTDFGYEDHFTGVLKGVIATIAPNATVIDLSHDIVPQNILQASFLLSVSVGFFPEQSIFCVIVDPEVGSDRKALCIKTRHYYFIGPDNGVLWETARADGIETMVELNNSEFFLDRLSATFHGRDVFSPVAAHLWQDMDNFSRLGPETDKCKLVNLPLPEKKGNSIELTILYIDRFGNLTLNITHESFQKIAGQRLFSLYTETGLINRVFKAYALADDETPFLVAGSSGYMEVAVKDGNAAGKLGISLLDKVVLTVHSKGSR